ncbi:hypothetical protein [Bacillus toyonensis]|uniref:hypothetical protein n=1 Tax=Bacillus toyonensis TaxID=155322 RepID=UPI002E2426E9|nr:hypothetical protein [Bacillus toyonensis]
MFYILMIVQLILIGFTFFLWFQLNREGFVLAEGTPSNSYKSENKTSFTRKPREPKKEKPKTTRKEDKKDESLIDYGNENEEFTNTQEEPISWDNFGMKQRDRNGNEDQREMDRFFGFEKEKVRNDNLLEQAKAKEVNKPKSLEDEFKELFDGDDLEETSSIEMLPNEQPKYEPEFVKPKEEKVDSNKKVNQFNDLDDFPNITIGDEEPIGYEEPVQNEDIRKYEATERFNGPAAYEEPIEDERSSEDDPYAFLKNYDLEAAPKDEITDDIFEKVRNQKSSEPIQPERHAEPSPKSLEDEWDFDYLKNDLPPVSGVNYEEPADKGVEFEKGRSSVANTGEDEQDDIFARLQRLSNMMDEQKK